MIDIGVVINLIKEKHCHDCDCLDVGDCYECDVYNIIEEIGDAFTEATKERKK